jgi:hypothetical protein
MKKNKLWLMICSKLILIGIFFTVTACKQTAEINISVEPEGSGIVEGVGHYNLDSDVVLALEPRQGFRFLHWSQEDHIFIQQNPWKITICKDLNLIAHLEKLISDPELEKALQKRTGGSFYVEDIAQISDLDTRKKQISDLSGLEIIKELEVLDLRGNSITDLSPIKNLSDLRVLYLCSESFEHISQPELIRTISSLEELYLEGVAWFSAINDVTLEDTKLLIFSDENTIRSALGKPEEKLITYGGYQRDPVGIFDIKELLYPGMIFTFIKEVVPPQHTYKNNTYAFKRLTVIEDNIKGPRGIRVGDNLDKVLERFPVMYQDEENVRRYGRIVMENGEMVELHFSDYISDSPWNFKPHHITLTIYFDKEHVIQYEICHVIYDL